MYDYKGKNRVFCGYRAINSESKDFSASFAYAHFGRKDKPTQNVILSAAKNLCLITVGILHDGASACSE